MTFNNLPEDEGVEADDGEWEADSSSGSEECEEESEEGSEGSEDYEEEESSEWEQAPEGEGGEGEGESEEGDSGGEDSERDSDDYEDIDDLYDIVLMPNEPSREPYDTPTHPPVEAACLAAWLAASGHPQVQQVVLKTPRLVEGMERLLRYAAALDGSMWFGSALMLSGARESWMRETGAEVRGCAPAGVQVWVGMGSLGVKKR